MFEAHVAAVKRRQVLKSKRIRAMEHAWLRTLELELRKTEAYTDGCRTWLRALEHKCLRALDQN